MRQVDHILFFHLKIILFIGLGLALVKNFRELSGTKETKFASLLHIKTIMTGIMRPSLMK